MGEQGMWQPYEVKLQIHGKLGGSLPKTPAEIEAFLTNRMPTRKPPDATPIDELAKKVEEEVGATEEAERGWSTFPQNGNGLFIEGRSIRGHLKDCAQQVAVLSDVKAFKAKVANKVYVSEDTIPLGVAEPHGTQQRFIHVLTRQGERSTIKFIDYVENPCLRFTLLVLNDGVITENHLRLIFDYGSIHGIGQERSQGWGRYSYTLREM